MSGDVSESLAGSGQRIADSYSRAAAPPMISLSSDVICDCRARLYSIEIDLIMSCAFS